MTPTTLVTRSWNDLSRKVKAALGFALAADTVSILGWLNGDLNWRTFLYGVVAADIGPLAAYLTRDSA